MPNRKSMASGDLTITLIRVGSFRAGRHGDHHAQTSHVLDCPGSDRFCGRLAGVERDRKLPEDRSPFAST
jgi:hypothetical protein